MDIFNLKKVRELEYELERVQRERDQFMRDLDFNTHLLEELLEVKAALPTDCVPGPYCKACEFSKAYGYSYYGNWTIGHFCGKSQSCKNFIQKERGGGG